MSDKPGSNSAEDGIIKVDLDTLLAEEIGEFGKYQAGVLAWTALIVIFAGWNANEYIFTTARINTRCLIPECDTPNPDFSTWWIDKAVPVASSGILDACQRYAGANSSAIPSTGTCPPELFNTDIMVDCEDYVYENTNTVVYDFGLACDDWRRSFIGSIRIFGAILGFIVAGYISDNWGRRIAFLVSTTSAFLLGTVRYWASSYGLFAFLQFFEAFMGNGSFSIAYIIAMEIVGRKYRVACGAIITSFFSIGQTSLAAIAWAVPHWRNLILTLYLPQVLVLLNIWLASESVRWYISKSRFAESEALLHRMARKNGKILSPKSLERLKCTIEEETKRKQMHEEETEWLVLQIFRHKAILYRVLISPILWITLVLIYYGLSVTSVNMTGNSYFNYMVVSAAEIPGFWTAVFLINKVGRKPVLTVAYWLCSASQVAYIFMPSDLYGASLTVYVFGKFSIAVVASALYVYTAEIYPTKHRQSLLNFSSMTGRVGSVLAPLMPAIGTASFYEMPFAIFAVLAFISGSLILTLPETLGTKLPDTMEEADSIGKKVTR